MAAISFDGLASGLNSTEIVGALMGVERLPQDLLKSKIQSTQNRINALQTLNSQTAALTELATGMKSTSALKTFTGNTSGEGAIIDSKAATTAGAVDFTVDQLAQGQTSVTGLMATWPHAGAFSIVTDAGVTEITPSDSDLDTIVTAINAAGAGVTASKVDVGGGQFRLMFSSTETGAAAGFDIVAGTEAEALAGTAPSVITATTKTAQDAKITLFPGTGVAQEVTSSTNKFDGVLQGSTITVSKVSTDPITATVGLDPAAAGEKVSKLVDGVNKLLGMITTGSKATVAEKAGGTTVSGLFAGNPTVRALATAISTAITAADPTRSPMDLGIEIQRDGTFKFDADKFAAALAKDPADTEAFMAKIAASVEKVGTNYSDKYEGLLVANMDSYKSQNTTNERRIDQMELRLIKREATLKKTYTNLEVAMQSMNSARSSLAAGLSGLPKWNPKS